MKICDFSYSTKFFKYIKNKYLKFTIKNETTPPFGHPSIAGGELIVPKISFVTQITLIHKQISYDLLNLR